jgi:pimeloyl-ACP methyl ester carboxylesterase
VNRFALLRRAVCAVLLLTLAASAGCSRKSVLAPNVAAPEAARAAEQFRHQHANDQAVHLEGRSESGALWVIDKPAAWNRSLVVYLHGYTLPSDPVALPNNGPVRDSLLARGYAVAASSYSSNGFAVPEGIRDSDALREIFRRNVAEPRHTYLFGRSLGGLIGMLMTQRIPEHYDGSLLVCGIVGGSTEEIQYIGDIRVLFDTMYPGVIPGDLEHSTPITDPNTQLIGPIVAAVTANPQGLGIIQLLARHPLAGANSQEVVASLINAMGFSMQAGSDLYQRCQSTSFFDNASYTYASAALPPPLLADINTRVRRYTRAHEAAEFLRRYGEPTSRLRIPMLSLHTTRDPQVPVFHEDLLAQELSSPLLIQRRVDRYGHDTFTAGELMVHFNDLVNFANAQHGHHDDDVVAGGALAGERQP